MNITRRYNIVAIVGAYQKEGKLKKKYQTVGALCETDTGPVIFLNRHFNPAGVPARDKDPYSIILSCYPEDGSDLKDNGFESDNTAF